MRTRNSERGTRNNAPIFHSLFRVPTSAFRVLLPGVLWLACGVPPAGDADKVIVTIPRGATLGAAIDSLAARGIIGSPGLFDLYARLRGLGSGLKSGVYAFRPDERWAEVVDDLKRGRGTLIRWSVPEGLMLSEVAAQAQAQLGVARDSFLAAARDPDVLRRLGLDARATSAEGYLYPTTYTVRVHVGARELVRLMIDRFIDAWTPAWQGRLDSLHLSRQQLVTLASIIQAEVRYAPDREYVSAVYHNRLRHGMKLDADPTVVFHGPEQPGLFVPEMLDHLLGQRRRPLPPARSVVGQPNQLGDTRQRVHLHRAALYPAPVPFVYFVAQPDGKHIFSVTFAEHQAAIRAVHRMRTAARAPQPPGR